MPHDDIDLSNFEHSRTPLKIAGWIMIAVGVVMCLVLIMGVQDANEGVYSPREGVRVMTIGSLCIMTVTGLIGALLLSIRKRVWVDFDEGALGTVTEVMGYKKRRTLPLSSDGKIVHAEMEVSTGEGERTVWVIEYACADGSIELHRQGNAQEGRAWAERFAAFLDVSLVEAVEGVFTVRKAADLNRSVMEQGLSDGLTWPAQEISPRVRWEPTSDGDVEVSIDPPGLGAGDVLGIAVAGGLAAYVLHAVDLPEDGWHVGTAIACLIVLALLAGILFYVVHTLRTALVTVQRWTVSTDGVSPTDSPSSRLPAAVIEQVEVCMEGSVSVRSDHGSHSLGTGLKKNEGARLRAVVLLGLEGLAPRSAGHQPQLS